MGTYNIYVETALKNLFEQINYEYEQEATAIRFRDGEEDPFLRCAEDENTKEKIITQRQWAESYPQEFKIGLQTYMEELEAKLALENWNLDDQDESELIYRSYRYIRRAREQGLLRDAEYGFYVLTLHGLKNAITSIACTFSLARVTDGLREGIARLPSRVQAQLPEDK
jgi:hypothetical protein